MPLRLSSALVPIRRAAPAHARFIGTVRRLLDPAN
jgi:hypothetical protein